MLLSVLGDTFLEHALCIMFDQRFNLRSALTHTRILQLLLHMEKESQISACTLHHQYVFWCKKTVIAKTGVWPQKRYCGNVWLGMC